MASVAGTGRPSSGTAVSSGTGLSAGRTLSWGAGLSAGRTLSWGAGLSAGRTLSWGAGLSVGRTLSWGAGLSAGRTLSSGAGLSAGRVSPVAAWAATPPKQGSTRLSSMTASSPNRPNRFNIVTKPPPVIRELSYPLYPKSFMQAIILPEVYSFCGKTTPNVITSPATRPVPPGYRAGSAAFPSPEPHPSGEYSGRYRPGRRPAPGFPPPHTGHS